MTREATATDDPPAAPAEVAKPWIWARATSYGKPLSDEEMWAIAPRGGRGEQIKETVPPNKPDARAVRKRILTPAQIADDIRLNRDLFVERTGITNTPRTRIYFARCQDWVKVGRTDRVVSRIQSLQCGSPEKLTLIGSYWGHPCDEPFLHKALVSDFGLIRGLGEWFSYTPLIEELIMIMKAWDG